MTGYEYLPVISIVATGLSALAIYYAWTTAKKVRENFVELEKRTERTFNRLQEAMNEIEALKNDVENLKKELLEIRKTSSEEREKLRDQLREDLLGELEEEIERLEERIEKRKDEEVKEFLDILKAAVAIEPEKVSSGLFEAKKALLSLRDIAKVYVLTEKGREEFQALKKSLIGLLKNLRRLVIVSVPDEEIYTKFRDMIIEVKRLDLPMKDEKSGKVLNPERSFIEIHKIIYKLTGEIDEIAGRINEPVPVTPVEREFYEKLRHQFEELRKLEEQVNALVKRLNKSSLDAPQGESKIEDILRDLRI